MPSASGSTTAGSSRSFKTWAKILQGWVDSGGPVQSKWKELETTMEPHPANQMLESVFVEMDPALDGFAGVLAELYFTGERYRLVLTARPSQK